MAGRLARWRAGQLPGARCFEIFTGNVDEAGAVWSDERVCTACVLMIWGAYIEVASLMVHSVLMLGDQPAGRAAAAEILAEAEAAGVAAGAGAAGRLEAWSAKALPWTQGVLRETLRLLPPNGGGFRVASEAVEIAGFEIPAGWVVTADPRIGNASAEVRTAGRAAQVERDAETDTRPPSMQLFPEPATFGPERWTESGEAPRGPEGERGGCPFAAVAGSAASLPAGGWFPGGVGLHSCPGIPLAELVCRMFLVRWLEGVESWERPPGDVAFVALPIKIPTDALELRITARRAGAGASAGGGVGGPMTPP